MLIFNLNEIASTYYEESKIGPNQEKLKKYILRKNKNIFYVTPINQNIFILFSCD